MDLKREILDLIDHTKGNFDINHLHVMDDGFRYKDIRIKKNFFLTDFEINGHRIDCPRSIVKDLFDFFTSELKKHNTDGIKKVIQNSITPNSSSEDLSDLDKKVIKIVDYIESNFIPTNIKLAYSYIGYKDDLIDIEIACGFTHFRVGGKSINISEKAYSLLYERIKNLHEKSVEILMNKKINSALESINEFKEFQNFKKMKSEEKKKNL